MSMEERGYYITLLSCQHQTGRIEKSRIRFLGFKFEEIPEIVLSKFDQDEKGSLFNKKMEDVISGYVEYVEKQKDNGKKGGRPKTKNTKPKQNPNESIARSESESDSVFESVERGGTGGESEIMNELLLDQQWVDQFRMKNRLIKDWSLFFEYLRNKCAIEDIDHDRRKVMARANLLALNWTKEKEKAKKATGNITKSTL